jgi:hypothetical protein
MIEPDALSYAVQTEAGALVGLSDGGSYLGSAVADETGLATVSIVGDLPAEEITLTVTHFNRLPHIESVTVGLPLVPACAVEPGAFSEIVLVGNVFQANLFVSNNGDPGSVLEYQIRPTDMTGDLGGAPSWLSMDAMTGAVPQGETDTRVMTLITDGLADGSYYAELIFSSNAPQTVIVPVTLIVTSDATNAESAPALLSLGQNYPNPFNPKTSISFALPQAGETRLAVYSASGQQVAILQDGPLAAGQHTVVWNGQDDAGRAVGTGVYFYRLEAEDLSLTRKMLLLK